MSPTYDSSETLELDRLDNGNLEYCANADGTDCRELPYTGECAVVTIVIDTISGQTCETCTLDNGQTVDRGCNSASVSCILWEVPTPDCVVCAYVNGDVIYSSCVPGNGPECSSDRECDAGEACIAGSCEPINTDPCALVDCAPGFHCEVEYVQCFAYPCEPQAACVPDRRECWSDADCPAGSTCDGLCYDPAGTRPACDPDAGTDCVPPCGPGVCVPSPQGCTDDSQCGAGEQCIIACEACPAGDANCGGCYGYCQPLDPDPCARIDCGPGYHCEVEYVQCFAYPCEPQAACVPDTIGCLSDADCPDGLICQWYDSTTGSDGIACSPEYCPPRGGVCVPPPPPSCQSDADCAAGEQCLLRCWDCMANDPTCLGGCEGVCVPVSTDPCSDVICPDGQQCELQEVVCIAYPCPPAPVCVPKDACSDVACPDGQHCELQDVVCFAYPCPPAAICVDDRIACQSDRECPAGERCDIYTCSDMPCYFDDSTGQEICPPCYGVCVGP